MWRPDGWKNPYLQENNQGDWVSSKTYEAGADAMLNSITLALFEKKLKVIRGKGYLTLAPVE